MGHAEKQRGFSILELLVAMTIMMILMGIASSLLYRGFGVKARESRRTDALTSTQAALNLLSREIANSGFGIYTADPANPSMTSKANNGIILADSDSSRIHIRTNINNVGVGPYNASCTAICTSDAGEDITFFFDPATNSIVRYDKNGNPATSVVVNRISSVTFQYYDYASDGTVTGPNALPTANTGRVSIIVNATLDPVAGQPNPAGVSFTSEVNLRNSGYMLRQY
ncbi:MAG TPA: prepilin-type N-terminal cleavage/methylation domain-containing protein [Pyrinomonadaceae bacterium]|nr:prepilin-type N-terminal cleavage/methylation domain-containing protein [Pyrinomonadaceae bacterium]